MKRTLAVVALTALVLATIAPTAHARGTPRRPRFDHHDGELRVKGGIKDYKAFPKDCAEGVPARLQKRESSPERTHRHSG